MRESDRRRIAWLGLIAWSGLLLGVVYGSSLRLPFLADDFFHLPYVDTHSVVQMWQTAEGLYYFRPLSFTLWKLMEPIFGFHNLFAQHALNLLLHLSNALMVGWLAGHLWRTKGQVDWRRRFLGATLFLLYPFSFEAVPWIGSLVHPLVTFSILVSVVSYAKLRATGDRRWGLISLAFTFLSPFAHENGALVVPLIALIELTDPAPAEALWRRLRRVAVWLVPVLIWFAIWRTVPAARGANHLVFNNPSAVLRNTLYFAQGAAYPLTWTGGWLRDTVGVNAFLAAIILNASALAIAALIQWRTRSNRRGLLPWLWIVTGSLPALFFLDYSYLSGAPRTIMVSSIGVAWLWADVIARIADWGRATIARRRFSVALAVTLGVALLIQNDVFIQSQLRVFNLAGATVRQVVDATVQANRVGQDATFINLPVWIAPAQSSYAIGQEGVVITPALDKLDTLVTVHTGQPARIRAMRFEAIRQEVPYYVGLLSAASDWNHQPAGQIFFTHYATDTIDIEPAGALGVTVPSMPLIAQFDRAVSLLDAAVQRTDKGLQIDLVWRLDQSVPDDVTVFVHVLDADGQLVAQADGDPIAGSYPFFQWPIGLVAQDVHNVPAFGASLAVRVGLYRRSTGERLMAVSDNGTRFADDAASVAVRP